MMFRTVFLRRFALFLCVVRLLSGFDVLGQIRDGGIDPANLGKGDWIYFISAATNRRIFGRRPPKLSPKKAATCCSRPAAAIN